MDNVKEIARRYDSSAEIYDNRYKDIQIHKYQEILSRVDFQDSKEIVDIGCGTGSFLGLIQSLLENGHSFVGIDLSHEMIKIAHAKHPDIDFVVADSDNLPLREGYFDRILSVTHLQNLPEPKQIISLTSSGFS